MIERQPGAADPANPLPMQSAAAPPSANASSRQLLVNVVTSYAAFVASVLLSFFLTPLVLHRLGASEYGLWAVITSIGGYVSVVDSGVSTATVRMVAAALALGDRDRLAEVLGTARAFFAATAALALLISLALLPFFGSLFHPPQGSLHLALISLVIMGAGTALTVATNAPQAALFGAGRNDRSAIIGIVLGPAILGAQILVVVLGGGLIGLFTVVAAAALAGLVATDVVATRTGLQMRIRGRASWRMLKELLRTGSQNALVSAAWLISYNLDVMVIGLVLPVREITPYDIALSTGNLGRNLATTGTNMFLPAYAHSTVVHDRERQFRLFTRSVMGSMAIGIPVVVAIGAFGQSLLKLWLGTVPPHTYQVAVTLNLVMVLQLPAVQASALLVGMGRAGLVARLALPAAVLNLGLSVLAARLFGPVGPAVGSLPQVLVLEMVVLPVISARLLGQSVTAYMKEALLPLLAPLASALAAAGLLLWLFGNRGKVDAVFEALAVVVASWASTAAVIIKTDPSTRDSIRRAVFKRD